MSDTEGLLLCGLALIAAGLLAWIENRVQERADKHAMKRWLQEVAERGEDDPRP